MEKIKQSKGNFTGRLGFILAAAGSAVGLGNLWRFPYVAAKDGGGLFVITYIIMALTFGFALLTTEVAIGRKTGLGPIMAYKSIDKKAGFLGWLSTIVPMIIFPYYCVIGGWVVRYGAEYITGSQTLTGETAGNFFVNFITGANNTVWVPIVCFLVFIGLTAVAVFLGVDKGIEKVSKVLMPALLLMIVGIVIYAMFMKTTDADGTTRTAFDGLKIFFVPSFEGCASAKDVIKLILRTMVDASSQMFYSLSIAMGIMIAYGAYAPRQSNLVSSVNSIEIFDTAIALLAGMIVIPAVFVFQGAEGLSKSGPSLMFISLPQVFAQLGVAGIIVGAVFFLLVLFAAVTSSISLMEAVTASLMDRFAWNRKKSALVTLALGVVIGVVVCLGYNVLAFKLDLGFFAGDLLDWLDFISNNLMMPIVALCTCIFVGWIWKPKFILDELACGMEGTFKREGLYKVMIKYVCPILLVIILLQSFGVVDLLLNLI